MEEMTIGEFLFRKENEDLGISDFKKAVSLLGLSFIGDSGRHGRPVTGARMQRADMERAADYVRRIIYNSQTF